ncbi:MAG: enoyl-CoA hydratase/isomerase family protein, partial [Pseudomonadota bacterium]
MSLSLEYDPTIAVVVIDNPPVNGISNAVRAGLAEQLARAEQAAAVRAIVITATGEHFLTGQDVREFGHPVVGPSLRELIEQMESIRLPLVVVAPGPALGGGMELMLCADRRVVAPRATLGFPEVKYGLLPGAGGTQRLPRLIGAHAALELMVSGKPVGAERALALGLVDEVFEPALTPVQAGLLAARQWLQGE